ncbi:unnamed protein product, partial [Discosporangium mesarthrocarpum]
NCCKRKTKGDHQPLSYQAVLEKTWDEHIEVTIRKRRILFAGLVARMDDTRLPKMVSREAGGQQRKWQNGLNDDLKLFRFNTTE